jgi:hypothetical protein
MERGFILSVMELSLKGFLNLGNLFIHIRKSKVPEIPILN